MGLKCGPYWCFLTRGGGFGSVQSPPVPKVLSQLWPVLPEVSQHGCLYFTPSTSGGIRQGPRSLASPGLPVSLGVLGLEPPQV